MIRYLAIDPGVKACGLAWRRTHPAAGDKIAIRLVGPCSEAFYIALMRAKQDDKVTVAVIEVHGVNHVNRKYAFEMAETRGRIIEACLRHGLQIARVNTSSWQSSMLRKSAQKGDSKQRSLESAHSLGVDTDDDNIADAVNLLVYAELNNLGEET